MAIGRPSLDDLSDQMYLVAPLADLLDVLEEFFDAYAWRREIGDDENTAVRHAVIQTLPGNKVSQVTAMLSGQIDHKLSVIKPFDGRQLCASLIERGERAWADLRSIPGWIESGPPADQADTTSSSDDRGTDLQVVSSPEEVDEIVNRLIDERGTTLDDAEAWVELGLGRFEDIVAWSMIVDHPSDAKACVDLGHSSSDVRPWIESEIAYDADSAVPWLEAGLSVDEVLGWRALSYVTEPNEVQSLRDEWASHGFDPHEAVEWASVDSSPATAEQWRNSDLSLDDARAFSGAYIDIDDAVAWIDAGFTANVAHQFAAEGLGVTNAMTSHARGLTVSAALRRFRKGDFDDEEEPEDRSGSASPIPHPEAALDSYFSQLLDSYQEARLSNRPLDSFFEAIRQTVPVEEEESLRSFALGELDDIYGAGAGYRATEKFVVSLEVVTETSQLPAARFPRWQSMNIVDLAQEIGVDPFLTDLFLWSMHNHMTEDGANLVGQMAVALISNASTARTRTGRQVKIDQAQHVLQLLAKKAHKAGPEHQEMWCKAISGTLQDQR